MRQGSVFRLDFSELFVDVPDDGEPAGRRFGVVVSRSRLNEALETVVIAPTTSSQVKKRADLMSCVSLDPLTNAPGFERESVIQLHLVYSINKSKLAESAEEVGRIVDPSTLNEISCAADWVFGFEPHLM